VIPKSKTEESEDFRVPIIGTVVALAEAIRNKAAII
jgi:hypothetical protein